MESSSKKSDDSLKTTSSALFASRWKAFHHLLALLFFCLLFTLFFSPTIIRDRLLAPGDGLLYHLVYFYSPKSLWDPMLGGGFPMMADPQVMSLYPPALLFSIFPDSWNAFVISAYVMASLFAYGYIYSLTASRLSALAGGAVYGMSGFMMAHLGHTAIIHSAAWLPLIVWSFEELRREQRPIWIVIGSFAVSSCLLAGHTQIFVYSLSVSLLYLLFRGLDATARRLRYYTSGLIVVVLGICLSGVQLLPFLELADQSVRASLDFEGFVSFSLPPAHAIMLLFPYLFGGGHQLYTLPYFGRWNITELSGYIGILPLLLAVTALFLHRPRSITLFWFVVAVLALLLSMGDGTPLSQITFHLPVINLFRAQGRFLLLTDFAFSILAGLGTAAFVRGQVSKRFVSLLLILAGAAMLLALSYLLSLSSEINALAAQSNLPSISLLPQSNIAVAIPLLLFIGAGVTLFFLSRRPASNALRLLLIAFIALDLSSFGWFHDWQRFSPEKALLTVQPPIDAYRDRLRETNERILSARGTIGQLDEAPPNLSRLWGLSSAGIYGPLTLSRVQSFLSMLPSGGSDAAWKDSSDQSLNLLGVRYLLAPNRSETSEIGGIKWLKNDLTLWLGSGCLVPQPERLIFKPLQPVRATSVAIVSRLACSVGVVPEGDEVIEAIVSDGNGAAQKLSLIAGRDTSEWSYDCLQIKPKMIHGKAQVFKSFPAMMNTESCVGYQYLAKLPLPAPLDISTLELRWTGKAGSSIIEKVSLVDDLTGQSVPLDFSQLESGWWRRVKEYESTLIYENTRALPRAWLVTEVATVKPEEALAVIKQSRLPDGRRFDPNRTAVIEETLVLPAASEESPTLKAQVLRIDASSMEVQTSASSDSFLVTGDIYYPGWTATIDGAPARLFRTNYTLRGVAVPRGEHTVRFEYRPASFYKGLALTVLSALVTLAFVFPRLFKRTPAERVVA